jgi:hypothetical protein
MDSIGTEQQMETTTAVRRVAIIGTPPGLGLAPTLIASSPHFRAQPRPKPAEQPHPRDFRRSSASASTLAEPTRVSRRGRRRLLGALVPRAIAGSPL